MMMMMDDDDDDGGGDDDDDDDALSALPLPCVSISAVWLHAVFPLESKRRPYSYPWPGRSSLRMAMTRTNLDNC